jgi:outer membrane receptor protein involved in Fe transport
MKSPDRSKKTLVLGRIASLMAVLSLACSLGFAQETPGAPAIETPEEADADVAAEYSNEVIELSPFEVSASEQTGYRGTSTLAGTRIKTDLKDLGSAISVYTDEFLEDTGATNMNDLLVYGTSTEIAGAGGNFAGPGPASGDANAQAEARANPQDNSRVRGLSKASLTRDYFLSQMGFDSYNTELITVSRGPNSILFGIGEPGGIVDHTMKKAMLGRELNQVGFRFGSYGTYRGTLDFNRSFADDRIALRFNAMHENVKYRQEPAYEEDTRFNIALRAVLFENENVNWLDRTVLRGSWETATIKGTPPDPIPPTDAYRNFWEPPGSVEADTIMRQTKPNYGGNWPDDWRSNYPGRFMIDHIFPENTTPGIYAASQPSIWNSNALIWGQDGSEPNIGLSGSWEGTQVMQMTSGPFEKPDGQGGVMTGPGNFPSFAAHQSGPWGHYGGWNNHSIRDTNIWPWEDILLQGETQYADTDFDAYNVFLEQTFLDGTAGIELAFDHQERYNERFFPFGRANYASIKIDVAKYLPNGELNPNVGRPFLSGQYDPTNKSWTEADTTRATAFYELDFTENDNWTKWLGKYTFTGLWQNWEWDNKTVGEGKSWNASHDADQNIRFNTNRAGTWGGRAFYMVYLGPSQYDKTSASQLELYKKPIEAVMPTPGTFLENSYYDKANQRVVKSTVQLTNIDLWPNRTRQEIDSMAFTVQGRFLQNNLVLVYGWRTDDSSTWQNQTIQNPDATFDRLASWENWKNDGEPVLEASGETQTLSAVAHVPTEWTIDWPLNPTFSVHWSESENFNPASVRRNIYNEVIQPPQGETTEMGFTVGLWRNKLNLRFNWYETASKNVRNNNIHSDMWKFTWQKGFADRWMIAKNGSYGDDGIKFEDIGWGNPANPNPEFDESATGDFTSYDEVINAILFNTMDPRTTAALNPRIQGPEGAQSIQYDNIDGLTSVADVQSKGFELEATWNITDNWRMIFNAANVESTFTNGLSELHEYMDYTTANLKSEGLWDVYRGGWHEPWPIRETWTNDPITALAGAQAKEDTVSSELRKWRFNLVTNYTFVEGMLRGFGVGGAIRWQDKIAIGYPLIVDSTTDLLIPDLANPYYGGEDWQGDIWFSYTTRLWDRTNMKIQLNFTNYIGKSKPLAVSANPDGQEAIIRSSPEERWFLTTTFDF